MCIVPTRKTDAWRCLPVSPPHKTEKVVIYESVGVDREELGSSVNAVVGTDVPQLVRLRTAR